MNAFLITMFTVYWLMVGFGVVLGLAGAGYTLLKKYHWLQLILGFTLSVILWPIALYNNWDLIGQDRRRRRRI